MRVIKLVITNSHKATLTFLGATSLNDELQRSEKMAVPDTCLKNIMLIQSESGGFDH